MRIVVSFVSGIRREVAGVGGKLGQFVKESKKGRFVQFLVGRAKRVGDSSGRASYGSLVLPGLLNLGSFVEARVKNLGRIRSEIPEFVARAVRQLVEDQVSRGVPRPLLASLSSSAAAPLETKHLFDVAMSTEQVARRLDGVPVYTVSNSANEFVLVSDLNSSKSLGLFCFREADASALLAQVFLKPFLKPYLKPLLKPLSHGRFEHYIPSSVTVMDPGLQQHITKEIESSFGALQRHVAQLMWQ
jgi:hypothetical protein